MKHFPIIAWDNLLARDNAPAVTKPADASGHPFANLTDWRDYTTWMTSATGAIEIKLDAATLPGGEMEVDTLAIAGHNLHTAGVAGLSFQHSDDDSSYTGCFTPIDPADDRVILAHFTSCSHQYFKLTIPAGYTATPELGVLFVGKAMEIPAYPDAGFDPDQAEIGLNAEHGRTGRLLGVASRYRSESAEASFSRLPSSFIEDEYVPFFDAHGQLPFFFDWSPDDAKARPRLVRLDGPKLGAPRHRAYLSLSLKLAGVAR